jgi:uncharacterized membrane protein (DUF485 family)
VEVVGVVKQVNKPVDEEELALDALAAKRFRMGMILTAVILAVPFSVILPIAFNKPLPSRILTDGLSLNILLGVLVVLVTWVLTWAHAEWANRITNQGVWIGGRLTPGRVDRGGRSAVCEGGAMTLAAKLGEEGLGYSPSSIFAWCSLPLVVSYWAAGRTLSGVDIPTRSSSMWGPLALCGAEERWHQ